MKQWEYKKVLKTFESGKDGAKEMEEFLNALGSQGWEIIDISEGEGYFKYGHGHYVNIRGLFKRRKAKL